MMNRRGFLGWLAAVAVLLPLRAASAAGSPVRAPRGRGQVASRALVDLFSDPRGARRIGSRYLAAYPGHNTPEALLAQLDPHLVQAAARGDTALRQRAANCQQHDFDRGDTVLVDNWVLSRTEARLCALAALAA